MLVREEKKKSRAWDTIKQRDDDPSVAVDWCYGVDAAAAAAVANI